MRKGVQRIGALACLLLLGGMPAAAQVSTGEIFGKAADGTGAVLPGVSVTLSGPSVMTWSTAPQSTCARLGLTVTADTLVALMSSSSATDVRGVGPQPLDWLV